ncbi:phosphoribosylglycinamide formyltransferase [Puniceicoccales bacterium CK1056]|uniref:Phosphoribosylglycinamide formyltransferase n=1 Tax=Oceanipulchritudo coccoides TaxID=2706888 RepID=A0A6B2M226_9BACT|nr:phosphoribosylglycinamide formyltransferase [Oceanipulchritudo coccoides]NDV62194.1 phosphoribosylglycinamide formyltransferase [Oceanipulchritudo coccoides]
MRFVILGSGTGSNAEALLKAWDEGKLGKAEPVAILSDKPEARILQLGKPFGVPGIHVEPGPFRTKLSPEGEQAYIEAIRATKADLVVLAGFMRVLKEPFLEAFPNRIINLHPSLLPSFKGLDGIRQAYEYGVKVTGCTVHFVSGELDGGRIIDQKVVPIERTDSLEDLELKVHAAEHELLPQVVRALAEGGLE